MFDSAAVTFIRFASLIANCSYIHVQSNGHYQRPSNLNSIQKSCSRCNSTRTIHSCTAAILQPLCHVSRNCYHFSCACAAICRSTLPLDYGTVAGRIYNSSLDVAAATTNRPYPNTLKINLSKHVGYSNENQTKFC